MMVQRQVMAQQQVKGPTQSKTIGFTCCPSPIRQRDCPTQRA